MLRRHFARWLLLGLLALSLAGCAEGTARDAEQGKARDEKRTSVIDELQSTHTSELVNSTPEASPTPS